MQPVGSPTRVKVKHPQPKHSFTGRISFLLVASVMEGVFCQIYLSVLTNDQSWPFNGKIKSPGGLSVKHFSRNTTLGFISMIITFTSGARNQFLGEDLFSLEHHHRVLKSGISERNTRPVHKTAKRCAAALLGPRMHKIFRLQVGNSNAAAMCNISLFFPFRLGRCITASDV